MSQVDTVFGLAVEIVEDWQLLPSVVAPESFGADDVATALVPRGRQTCFAAIVDGRFPGFDNLLPSGEVHLSDKVSEVLVPAVCYLRAFHK